MGKPVKLEIRKKILEDKLVNKMSTINVANKYNVSESLVYKVLKENRETDMYDNLINVKDILSNKKDDLLNELIINDISVKCNDITLNKVIKGLTS